MKLTVLVDNNTLIDRYFYAEPGLSFLIEDEKHKILFDVGYSNIFIKNAYKMNMRFWDLDYLVLSHGHLDHTWGLMDLIKLFTEATIEDINYQIPVLVAHPHIFFPKEMGSLKEIGSMVTREEMKRHFLIKLSTEPVWLTDKLVFLGEIKRENNFEAKNPIGKINIKNDKEDDFIMDDSALAYRTEEGLIIITGCSHSGICNIIEQAKKICNEERIIDIIGGFHLLDPDRNQLEGTLKYFKKLQPKILHACHCTDLNSKIALSKISNLKEVGVGLVLNYN